MKNSVSSVRLDTIASLLSPPILSIYLGESGAILQYIAESQGPSDWYPTDPIVRAKINFWLHWNHENTRVGTKKLLVGTLFPPKVGADEAKKNALKSFTRAVSFVDQKLASQEYLAGTKVPSIADLLLIPEFDQHLPTAFNLFDYSPFPHVNSWMKRMALVDTYEEVFDPVRKIAEKYKAK